MDSERNVASAFEFAQRLVQERFQSRLRAARRGEVELGDRRLAAEAKVETGAHDVSSLFDIDESRRNPTRRGVK